MPLCYRVRRLPGRGAARAREACEPATLLPPDWLQIVTRPVLRPTGVPAAWSHSRGARGRLLSRLPRRAEVVEGARAQSADGGDHLLSRRRERPRPPAPRAG